MLNQQCILKFATAVAGAPIRPAHRQVDVIEAEGERTGRE
jgi:hypothetical protein